MHERARQHTMTRPFGYQTRIVVVILNHTYDFMCHIHVIYEVSLLCQPKIKYVRRRNGIPQKGTISVARAHVRVR
jgi:hypothetical protein